MWGEFTMFRLAQLGFAAALAMGALSLAGSSAHAFTMETIGGSSDGSSRFADPDDQVKNFGQGPGAHLFGPGGPTMQFGAQQGGLSPFGPRGPMTPGFASPQAPPDPYNLNNPNRF
jgi:hypothetical protein